MIIAVFGLLSVHDLEQHGALPHSMHELINSMVSDAMQHKPPAIVDSRNSLSRQEVLSRYSLLDDIQCRRTLHACFRRLRLALPAQCGITFGLP
jgi:hypothetical protein